MVTASALSLALAPNLAGALALGDIRAWSALGEPFAGRIELLDVAPDELDTLEVRLASQAEFDQASTPRPHFLTGLKFEPRISPEGRAMIRVTSRRPVREPFLDFLIEIAWPQGRLVGAYTVLLDPPATRGTPSPEAATPETMSGIDERIEALRGRIRKLETQLADIQRLLALDQERIAAAPGTEATPVSPAARPGSEVIARTAVAEQTPVFGHWFRESLPRFAPAWVPALALPFLLLGWLFRRRRGHRGKTASLGEPVLRTPGIAAAGLAAGADSAGPVAAPIAQISAPIPASTDGFGDPDQEDAAEGDTRGGLETDRPVPWRPAVEPSGIGKSQFSASDSQVEKPTDGLLRHPHREREETDLVSEADIYIAYGRYREAETLLEQALAESPQRPDIKYRLIEVHYGTRNRERMETLMDQLQETGADRMEPEQWQRCKAMLEALEDRDPREVPPTAASGREEGLAPVETGFTERREAVFSPLIPPDPAPEPESAADAWASGITGAPDALRATRPRTDLLENPPQGSPEDPDTPSDDGMIIPWPKEATTKGSQYR
ncbi:MAG: tetratricopeptide repeat protein [Candidatus Thiosymbion ectosymbiont of Robbea hypermnestra]|nr:tetratricopeptide repeat protein [Candidatus Thiosymbion ectosymbiont of Robbea hypermnestra]